MKAAFTILQAMLIMLLILILAAMTLPWAMENVGTSMDLSEFKTIKSQFNDCNQRIVETARTGTTNTCIFNIKRGEITGRKEGINYKIVSNAPLCDASPLVEIDPRNHVWQECNVSGKQRIYNLLWKFPSSLNVTGEGIQGNQMVGQTNIGNIGFDEPVNFETLSLYVNFQYQPGQAGSVVELSRVDITQTNVTLKVKIS
jgi:type II secretory pathway pseudopilin PulG